MRIIEPSVELVAYTQLPPTGAYDVYEHHWKQVPKDPCSEMSRIIEIAGRTSWKSEDKMGPGTADGFCVRVVNIKKDLSIAEHCSVTLRVITDRYTLAQLTRHRIAAYTVESSHYINYGKKGRELAVCRPLGIPQFRYYSDGGPQEETEAFKLWRENAERDEATYFALLDKGVKHYHSRFAALSCLKTEIVVTYNLRMWRTVFDQRLTSNNTPEIVHAMMGCALILAKLCPEVMSDYGKVAEKYFANPK